MTGTERFSLIDERRVARDTSLGQHLVEKNGVYSANRQILVRMHIVFVDDGLELELGLCVDEQVVGKRGAERCHPPAAKICERAEAWQVGLSDGENFAEFVVGNRDRVPLLPRGCVFEPTQADVEVSTRDSLVEARKGNLNEARYPSELRSQERRDIDVEADDASGIARVGFDKGRSAFGIAAPAQFDRRLRSGRGGKQQSDNDG
jgi:hypothetical protein